MAKEIEIPEGYEAKIENDKVIFVPKESEDERIMKEIIQFLRDASNSKTRVISSEILAKWAEFLEKRKEQKPIEGNSLFDKIMNILLWEPQRYTVLEAEKTTKAICSIFKEQKPAEWSEEDEKYLNLAINIVASDFGEDSPTVSWLKSLRPKPHWKPSKEQMEALNSIILTGSFTYVGQVQDLISLKNDIKSL